MLPVVVTSSLLPVKGNFSLLPIFTGANVLHYYQLLISMLISDATVVHVPVQSYRVYIAYHTELFPFKVNTTILTLNLPQSLIL